MPVALVTGAGGNLGRVAVSHFLDNNWTVVATVSPGKTWTGQPHARLHTRAVNLTHTDEVSRWLEEVFHHFGQVHAGLMLAGGFAPAGLNEAGGNAFMHMLKLNAITAWNVAQPLALHMMQHRQGRLIFIGARAGLNMAEGTFALPYAFSKSLLLRFNEALNHAGKEHNVRSCVLIPRIIDTPDNRKAMPKVDFSKWIKPETMAEKMLALVNPLNEIKDEVMVMD